MSRPLVWAVVLASLVSAAFAVAFVWRAFTPPDWSAAVMLVVWLGGPFLLAVVLALVHRRHRAALWALLVTVILAGAAGGSVYESVTSEILRARHEVETAVLPGEDPNSGPGGKRKAAAGIGAFVTDVIGVAVLVVIPPAQALAVAVASGVGYMLSVWLRGRAEARRVWVAEHTDDQG